jgi:hypothetical protein
MMSKITKIIMFLFVSQIFCACFLYSQAFKNVSKDDQKEISIPRIDGTPLLKNQEKLTAEFYKNNPDFLKTNKLNKTTGWNFKVGSKKIWFTIDFSIEKEYPTATTCRGVGKHCYVFVQDSIWDENLYQNVVDSVIAAFDNKTPANSNRGIYQTNTETFGNPPDIDNDNKIIILLLDIKDFNNGNTITGFYSTRNELPKSNFPASNEAEIIFIDVASYPAPWILESLGLTLKDCITLNINSYLATIAHEFQHLIAWNYNKLSSQWTFIDEGCSLAAEIINGFPIYREFYYTGEPNHYLFDWRSTSDVINDYSRASKFHLYLYEQFGPDIFKHIVQSGKIGIEAYNTAFANIGASLKLNDVVSNWIVANCILDRSFDPKYDYVSPVYINTVLTKIISPEGTVNKTIQPYGSEAISVESGKNVHIEFTSSSDDLKIKGIYYGKEEKKIVDIDPNTSFYDPELGVKYNRCVFVAYNLGLDKPVSFNAKISGEPTNVELKWNCERPLSRHLGNPDDVRGVIFDALPGGTLDSIKVAVYRKGKLTGKIYKHPTKYGAPFYNIIPVPISKQFTSVSDTEVNPYPHSYPHKNWLNIDLRDEHISTNDPFIVGIDVQHDTANYPQLMYAFINCYGDFYEFWYSKNINQWESFTWSEGYVADLVPMISAYVSFKDQRTTNVVEMDPYKYSLSQNFPNPFNPETSISFSIPKKGLTILKIYDIMGREVKILMNEVKEAGDHIIKFSAENLSSGVYFYKIKCDDFVDTKKMMLLR